jgi:hypothetical protein
MAREPFAQRSVEAQALGVQLQRALAANLALPSGRLHGHELVERRLDPGCLR